MKTLADCKLYTFVDTAYLHGRNPAQVAEQLCAGESDIIQLRAKDLPEQDVLRLAEQIIPITRAAGIPLVINDHLAIARKVGAQFCHLGQEDFFEAGRERVAQLDGVCESLQIGLSTHAPHEAARAIAAQPSYIAIGPIYATGTKPTAKPVTLDYVKWAKSNVTLPWFAIGGINLRNLDEVLQAGARRICVVSAILNAPDIAATCREFKARL